MIWVIRASILALWALENQQNYRGGRKNRKLDPLQTPTSPKAARPHRRLAREQITRPKEGRADTAAWVWPFPAAIEVNLGLNSRSGTLVSKIQIPRGGKNAGIKIRLPAQDQEQLNQCNSKAGRVEKKTQDRRSKAGRSPRNGKHLKPFNACTITSLTRCGLRNKFQRAGLFSRSTQITSQLEDSKLILTMTTSYTFLPHPTVRSGPFSLRLRI